MPKKAVEKKSEPVKIDGLRFDANKVNNDYGFAGVPQTQVKTLSDRERFAKIEELVLPLLYGLLNTADKPTINWPDRGPVIQDKIDQLLKLTRD